MFKTLIILYARSFWVTECTPNPDWSFPHWLAPMLLAATHRACCRVPTDRLQFVAADHHAMPRAPVNLKPVPGP